MSPCQREPTWAVLPVCLRCAFTFCIQNRKRALFMARNQTKQQIKLHWSTMGALLLYFRVLLHESCVCVARHVSHICCAQRKCWIKSRRKNPRKVKHQNHTNTIANRIDYAFDAATGIKQTWGFITACVWSDTHTHRHRDSVSLFKHLFPMSYIRFLLIYDFLPLQWLNWWGYLHIEMAILTLNLHSHHRHPPRRELMV